MQPHGHETKYQGSALLAKELSMINKYSNFRPMINK